MSDPTCPTCAADPKAAPRRYCARLRCLCGHDACPAFASWRPLPELNVTTLMTKSNPAWSEREEPTWIDQM